MSSPKGEKHYIRIAYRFCIGASLEELAEEHDKAKSTIRSNIKRAVGEVLSQHTTTRLNHERCRIHLKGFRDWEDVSYPSRKNFRFIRRHKNDIRRLIEGKIESTVETQFEYKSIRGYCNWSPTVDTLNNYGSKGWEVVDRQVIGEANPLIANHLSKKEVDILLRRRVTEEEHSVEPALPDIEEINYDGCP